jgi:hypothetical protein
MQAFVHHGYKKILSYYRYRTTPIGQSLSDRPFGKTIGISDIVLVTHTIGLSDIGLQKNYRLPSSALGKVEEVKGMAQNESTVTGPMRPPRKIEATCKIQKFGIAKLISDRPPMPASHLCCDTQTRMTLHKIRLEFQQFERGWLPSMD